MIAVFALALAIAIPPRPTSYVTDNAGALSTAAAQQIRNELRGYEQTTQHHVIVWIGQTTGDTQLEDWTIHAAEKWKIGRSGIDDGAILFLFMQDRKVRIEVGYGLESALTDAGASEIIRDTIVPRMRAGDIDGAVQSGVDRMLLTITPSFASQVHYPAPVVYKPSAYRDAVLLVMVFGFVVLFIGFMTFAMISTSRRGTWYSGSSDSGGWSGSGGGSDGGGSDSGSSGGSFGGGGASGSW